MVNDDVFERYVHYADFGTWKKTELAQIIESPLPLTHKGAKKM